MPRSPSQQPPQRARLFSSASWPFIGAGQLCHAPPAAMAASGIAVRQGLAAYHQERGNLATLPSQQRPPRATLSSLASRPFIGAGQLCHAPPAAMPATGCAVLQGQYFSFPVASQSYNDRLERAIVGSRPPWATLPTFLQGRSCYALSTTPTATLSVS